MPFVIPIWVKLFMAGAVVLMITGFIWDMKDTAYQLGYNTHKSEQEAAQKEHDDKLRKAYHAIDKSTPDGTNKPDGIKFLSETTRSGR